MLETGLPVVFELNAGKKAALRSQARRGRNRISGWANKCKLKNERDRTCNCGCEIHHVVPLQFAHHFKEHSNSNDNIVLLSRNEHLKMHSELTRALAGLTEGTQQWKNALENFKRKIQNDPKYADAIVPLSFRRTSSVLKEIMAELNL